MIVQFKDRNLSSKDVHVSDTELWVKDIFYTIQGEGPYMGFPAIFLRLAGCNRGSKEGAGCTFCDTNFLLSSSKVMTHDAIREAITFYKDQTPTSLVVITGGEPLMHKSLPALIDKLVHLGYKVQIETNGDYVREDTISKAMLVVSPKVDGHRNKYATPPKGMLQRADFLKILVSADPNSPYHKLPDYVHDFAWTHGSSCVFLSPINEYKEGLLEGEIPSMWGNERGDLYDREACGKNHGYAAALALHYSFRVSLQMHTYLALV